MVKKYKVFIMCLFNAMLVLQLLGCGDPNLPPDVSSVESVFQQEQSNFLVIVNFLTDSGYKDIYVRDSQGIMTADLSHLPINDHAALCAVKEVMGNGCISITKNGGWISFLQWRGIRDIGCGIVYAPNLEGLPDIQFLTELVPLSVEGWFYYVSDYNSWRSGRRACPTS